VHVDATAKVESKGCSKLHFAFGKRCAPFVVSAFC